MASDRTHFVFVIETGFTMQAFSSAIEVLRVARKLGADDFAYQVASLDDAPVAASNGISVLPDCPISDLPRHAIVVIVSGAGADRSTNPDLIAKLRLWHRQGHPIWAISSGVVRLAQAGLADGARVAAHWEDITYLKEHHPEVEISTRLFIGDARHPTCSGGGAASDLMLDFLSRSGRTELVEEIASRLMIDGVRDGRLSQSLPEQMRYATANKTVFAAIRLMEANTFDALSILEIARRLDISQRQLERLFNAEFGKTPAIVYAELRLGEARQEVLAGRRPLIDIALDYGYQPRQFSKSYRKVFGLLPSDDRKANQPPVS